MEVAMEVVPVQYLHARFVRSYTCAPEARVSCILGYHHASCSEHIVNAVPLQPHVLRWQQLCGTGIGETDTSEAENPILYAKERGVIRVT